MEPDTPVQPCVPVEPESVAAAGNALRPATLTPLEVAPTATLGHAIKDAKKQAHAYSTEVCSNLGANAGGTEPALDRDGERDAVSQEASASDAASETATFH